MCVCVVTLGHTHTRARAHSDWSTHVTRTGCITNMQTDGNRWQAALSGTNKHGKKGFRAGPGSQGEEEQKIFLVRLLNETMLARSHLRSNHYLLQSGLLVCLLQIHGILNFYYRPNYRVRPVG